MTAPTVQETAPLLQQHSSTSNRDACDQADQTTWRIELRFLTSNSIFLVLASLLYYSIAITSIVLAGRLGSLELGAVSLANVTANVTGIVIFQGLATTLDTLCAQAYGSGNLSLVGLNVQRMTFLLWCITIPVAILWLNATTLLKYVIPDEEVASLAGQYLKVLIFGAPGVALFESVKRYLQVQGHFAAILVVLVITATSNFLLTWFLVTRPSLGFIGIPIAVATTYTLLPVLLIGYAIFFTDPGCWPGFNSAVFRNWMPMLKLALPGLCMIEAEYLAFEILILASSYLSTDHLAAQTVMASLSNIFWQLPFPTSIVATTRIAEHIGAGRPRAAKKSAATTTIVMSAIGTLNGLILTLPLTRHYVLPLFSGDEHVRSLVENALPFLAAMQIVDAAGANGNGILRGIGRQSVGGIISLGFFYTFALPFSFWTAFKLGWGLRGLWSGVTIALAMIVVTESLYLTKVDWQLCVTDAEKRNQGSEDEDLDSGRFQDA